MLSAATNLLEKAQLAGDAVFGDGVAVVHDALGSDGVGRNTRIGLRRGTHVRRYEYDFIELFASHLTRKAVDMAMAGIRPDEEYQL